MKTAAQILVEEIIEHQISTVFCVPGESFLSVLDAFYDQEKMIKIITCRHEASAANMAEAYGKLEQKPGICFVTRGPGACHAAIALHTAYQDSTPMILCIGQVSRQNKDREAFQEMEYRQLFSSTTKWVAEINTACRMAEYVKKAFHIAQTGRPGPVVLVLPEDMLKEPVEEASLISSSLAVRPSNIRNINCIQHQNIEETSSIKTVQKESKEHRKKEYRERANKISAQKNLAPPLEIRELNSKKTGTCPVFLSEIRPDLALLDVFLTRLAHARNPLLLIGGVGWGKDNLRFLERFVEHYHLPVATVFRSKDRFNNQHSNYIGEFGFGVNPELLKALQTSDLILVIGARLDDVTSQGYQFLSSGQARKNLIHIHISPDAFSSIFIPSLFIQASPTGFLTAINEYQDTIKEQKDSIQSDRIIWCQKLRKCYQNWILPVSVNKGVNLSKIFQYLSQHTDKNTIITNGAGNYAIWLHRFYEHKAIQTQLAPLSGAMGYGIPAAITAKLLYPKREVIAIAGDGCFMMSVTELATIVQYRLKLLIIIANNNGFGTIRMHQESTYPRRVSATELQNPDFMRLANAYGFEGIRVEKTEAFPKALDFARKSQKSVILECLQNIEEISPSKTLSNL